MHICQEIFVKIFKNFSKGDRLSDMDSKQRLLTALERKKPDRLPVTTHHVMPYFLKHTMGGISVQEFFDYFGLDPIQWVDAQRPDPSKGDYFDPVQQKKNSLQPGYICSDNWIIQKEDISDPKYNSVRYRCVTPKRTLTTALQSDEQTTWVTERLIKDKPEIDIFAKYASVPLCDVSVVAREAQAFGERGLVRGTIPGFDIYGQPGCWQDAAVLYGIEDLILATYDDPLWVHEFLAILKSRKLRFIQSMKGALYDLVELGGGDASSTVISPKIFENFVAPYDAELIDAAHNAGQRVVYHTCGGMMPLLEMIADMKPDAMETFTPSSLGGDADLARAKKQTGHRVCLIGGFDQFHYFKGCTPTETREAVRRCFEEAGEGGGYILSPSDHFFEADIELLEAYAEEARKCVY
jgi:uroporphyrinogen decarboxylase